MGTGRAEVALEGPVEPARRVSAAERREQYLDVAADLVVHHGAEAVTMEAVAAGAQVNKALLYRQFSNRNEILFTLYDREATELDQRLVTAMSGVDDFEHRVRAWVHTWFAYMGRHGTLYYRLIDAARTIASSTAEAPHRDRQRRIIASHASAYEKQFNLAPDRAADAAAVLFAGLSGAIDRWASAPTAATRRRLEDVYVQAVLGTLDRLASDGAGAPVAGAPRVRRRENGRSSGRK